MRKTVLTLIIFFGIAASAQADVSAMAATLPDQTRPNHSVMGGMVKTVSWADAAKGTKSEIVVIDANKKQAHILVTSTTTVWDAQDVAVLPEKILPKSHVNVIYFTTPEGINIGKSIKILK